ncbi:MAG: fasciclin domain-containing protein [Actinomycetes bacterium]
MRRSRAATAAIAVVIAGAVALTGCGSKADDAKGASTTTTAKAQLTAKMTVGKIAGLDGQFAQFLDLATAAGITAELDAKGPITVFAPNSESIVKLGKAKIDGLKGNKSNLKVVLENHIVEGKLSLADLAGMNGKTLEAVSGRDLLVKVNGNVVTVGGAKVVKSNIDAENGAVFVVDGLVQPQS